MATQEKKAFVRRQIEEIHNRGNLDYAEECFTPDFVGHNPLAPKGIRGPEGFKQSVAAARTSFPDWHVEIVDQIAEGEQVVTRYVMSGTHKGEMMGIPPTGNHFEVPGTGVDRFSGARISESWEAYDTLGIMQQLGLVPTPEQV